MSEFKFTVGMANDRRTGTRSVNRSQRRRIDVLYFLPGRYFADRVSVVSHLLLIYFITTILVVFSCPHIATRYYTLVRVSWNYIVGSSASVTTSDILASVVMSNLKYITPDMIVYVSYALNRSNKNYVLSDFDLLWWMRIDVTGKTKILLRC